jgi:hypothetical protein
MDGHDFIEKNAQETLPSHKSEATLRKTDWSSTVPVTRAQPKALELRPDYLHLEHLTHPAAHKAANPVASEPPALLRCSCGHHRLHHEGSFPLQISFWTEIAHASFSLPVSLLQ